MYAESRNERINAPHIRQSGSQDIQAPIRNRKDKLANLPDITIDNNNYSPYRKYKQNKDIYEEPLNVRGGQILSIKSHLNNQQRNNKINYRYGSNIGENSQSVAALRDRDRNRNISRHRSILKDSYDGQSPDILQDNKNNLDMMIQDLNRYQVLNGNVQIPV